MNLTLSFKNLFVFLLLAGIIAFVSCQKELNNQDAGATNDGLNFSTKVTTSMVSGFVSDETNGPVKNATVSMGTAVTSTDKDGYFEFRNIEVVKNAGFVTVIMPGYFKGIKTFVAEADQGAFFRIKLIPKTNTGLVDAAAGGKVTLSNNMSVSLPTNAVVNAVTGAVYNGAVKVAAFWINPEAADLNEIMPGDLRGINTAGAIKLLQTYGMAAVELTGASGELLQIAADKKATLSFPLPTSLATSAPATIPLWYFNETNGFWKEDGAAIKTGNFFVGDVSHFSYWNCDIPFSNGVHFDLNVEDSAGKPLRDVNVLFYLSSGGYTGAHGLTDSAGHVAGTIPSNSQLVMKIGISIYGTCANFNLYSQPVNTRTSSVSLNTVKILTSNASFSSGSGIVYGCNGLPVSRGYVTMYFGSTPTRYNLNINGTFDFSTAVCTTVNTASFEAVDYATSQQSIARTLTLLPGSSNIVPSLTACGLSTQTFFNYYINGAWTLINPPSGSTFHPQDSAQINAMNLVGDHLISNTLRNTIRISVGKQNIAAGSTQPLIHFETTQTGVATIVNPIGVHITEYGNIGEYIAGDFNGTVVSAASATTFYSISGAFRIKRQN